MAGRGRASTRGSSRDRRAPASITGRDTRVDMLRGLALLVMFVAECAPSNGRWGLIDLARFAAAPLFALLIGIGAQLGDRGSRGLPAAFVRAGLRAAVLVALSFWMESWDAPVEVILLTLAVPTLLAPVLARLPMAVLLGIGTICWAAGPALRDWGRTQRAQAAAQGDDLGRRLWDAVVAGEHVRLTTLLVFTCLGIVIWRAHASTHANVRSGLAGLAAVVAAGALVAAKNAGRLSFHPFSGDHLEVFFTVLLVGGIAAVWFAVVPQGAQLPALTVAGAMTLSVYVAHVAYLVWVAPAWHSGRSGSWVDVGVLTVGALVLPMLWRSVLEREPWSKGPIEGTTAAVTRLIR